MSRPLIGVPGMWSSSVHGLRFDGVAVAVQVLRSIAAAGGEPVVMFPGSTDGSPDSITAQLARFDAVVLPGGADVSPALYGAEPDEHYWPADYEGQDGFEAGIITGCIEAGVPLLAICRGLQLLNVGRGGTLVQHLAPGPVQHKDALHAVEVAPGSLLASVIGAQPAEVSSYHHQAVGALGEGLRVTATAPDGVVEALEVPGVPLLAVQWHPEDTAATNPADHALFEWVVGAARQRRGRLDRDSAAGGTALAEAGVL
ncbi:gamma-glutamyl-gamma-aminobutyrate hydrolase family protein [Arthrobacter mobilis]|uniref:Gamma-glutamyl-gamma-aminobutyrate hydrolase family protein n=1 Tax=Arthrobacter mobilis TaxID=2724944 RepID=A0A7X6HGD6_9MICC|nr:gamma-glutamyl-gamma-aminobutyrate hydrolase family protein [Arthrobacter mobilis]NKX55187.1 gamma-glutamyl-gamma-aminobutyrate hydrolase family protein [Arthrobacter mobilis]